MHHHRIDTVCGRGVTRSWSWSSVAVFRVDVGGMLRKADLEGKYAVMVLNQAFVPCDDGGRPELYMSLVKHVRTRQQENIIAHATFIIKHVVPAKHNEWVFAQGKTMLCGKMGVSLRVKSKEYSFPSAWECRG